MQEDNAAPTRRGMLKTTAAISAAAALSSLGTNFAHAAARETIRVGLVGWGDRGKGAAVNACQADPKVELYAMGDLFNDKLESTPDEPYKNSLERAKGLIQKELASLKEDGTAVGKLNVTDDRCFVGWDAYKQVLAQDIDYVILATPPGFRPMMMAAAVEAGKHMFLEKPVAVDPVGCQKIIAAGEAAAKKGLSVVAGTQRRHQQAYIDTIKQFRDGLIGDITSGWVYWMQGGARVTPRKPEWSDVEWQIRNWPYFVWLSGDHIVEQHVHQADVMNWVMGGHPTMALGMGGRQARTDPMYGYIWDHFAVEYQFAEGKRVLSMARQTDGAYGRIREQFIGSKGWAYADGSLIMIGNDKKKTADNGVNPYVQEHADLIAAIRSGKPLNESATVAESCLTAIMGRISAYTGKIIRWSDVTTGTYAKLDLWPKRLDFNMTLPVPPAAVPGIKAGA